MRCRHPGGASTLTGGENEEVLFSSCCNHIARKLLDRKSQIQKTHATTSGHQLQVCTITVDSFKLFRNPDLTLTANSNGQYNYDDDWAYDQIVLWCSWKDTNGILQKSGNIAEPNEANLAIPSKWDFSKSLPNLPFDTTVTMNTGIFLKLKLGEKDPEIDGAAATFKAPKKIEDSE